MGEPPTRPPRQKSLDGAPPVRPLRQMYADAAELPYFFPQLSNMTEVKAKMTPYLHKDGYFLLRLSTSAEKTYTVSVTYSCSLKHFKVLRKGAKFYLQTRLFNSLKELIDSYRNDDVPNVENIRNVRLIHPICNDQLHFASSVPSFTTQCSVDMKYAPTRRSSEQNISKTRANFTIGPSSSPTNENHVRGSPILSDKRQRQASITSLDEDPNVTYNRLFSRMRPLPQLPAMPGKFKEQNLVPESNDTTKRSSIEQRPPAPLPVVDENKCDSNGIYNGVYYSCVKRAEENRLTELLSNLEVDDNQLCECGLDTVLSELPMGWSVHICRDEAIGYGRPFFVGPTQVTSWELPREIYLELDRNQQRFIKLLCENHDDGKPPPTLEEQLEWSSSSSSYTGSGFARSARSQPQEGASSGQREGAISGQREGASSGQRDSTGSNNGASNGGGFIGRGITDFDASGAETAL